MLTKEQVELLNPKSLWIPFTEETDWDAIDFDDMFVLCDNEGGMKIKNGRAYIYYSEVFHPASLNDDDERPFFVYQCDEKGVYHLKLTEAGKKMMLDDYIALLPLNFNIYQTFREYLESDVPTDSALYRKPLMLIYESGYIDTLAWMEYSSYYDDKGKEHFSFPFCRYDAECMNNIKYGGMPGDGLDEKCLEYVLDMNKCPLTRMFDTHD